MSEEEKAISELKSLYVHSENITYEQKFAIATALNLIKKLEKEAQKYFEEIKKQDREIDLMAECIDVELSSARLGIILNKNVQPLENYKEYIKQYFKSKAEKE